MTRFGIALCMLASAVLASGCFGNSREVDSCYDCVDYEEYCVEDSYGGQLYCADGCASHLGCRVGYSCVPLLDQGTLWTDDSAYIRWVCMDDHNYTGMGSVWRTEDDCGTGMPDECPPAMQCLYDDYNPSNVVYFCSDPCDYDSDCMTGCCELSSGYCAPYDPYCN